MDATRHNMLALGLDLALFLVGLSFASQSTILPAFAASLGAPNVVVGAIPAVMMAGWLLPSLFAAGHTETLPRKLPFVLRYTVWERAPFLGLAAAAFMLAERAPGLTLGILLVTLLVVTGVGGLLMPAWTDIVGRTIPTTLRGRFFAGACILGTIGGLLGSAATTYVLAMVPAPASYGLCFLGSAAFMGLSWGALALVCEPPGARRPAAPGFTTYLARIPGLLRRDRNFSRFLLARACALAGYMADGFFTVYALRTWEAPAWRVGVFTAFLFAGQIGGNVVFGWLADRAGHRLILVGGAAATAAADLIALSAGSLEVSGGVFALLGVLQAANNVSSLSILLEFAPTVEERPTYVGLGNTSSAPVALAAPLAAGLLADTLGFRPVFVVAAGFALAALALLAGGVRDPRARAGERDDYFLLGRGVRRR